MLLSKRFYGVSRLCCCVLSVIIILLCAGLSSSCAQAYGAVRLQVKCYMVYCTASPDGEGNGDIGTAVRAYGGAGYNFSYDGTDYVAVGCFMLKGEAQDFVQKLDVVGFSADVKELSEHRFELYNYSAAQNAEGYTETLKQLYELIRELCGIAEALDYRGGEGEARSRLVVIAQDMSALLAENEGNCFTPPLARLSVLAADCAYRRLLYARDVRYLQMGVADVLFNTRLT